MLAAMLGLGRLNRHAAHQIARAAGFRLNMTVAAFPVGEGLGCGHYWLLSINEHSPLAPSPGTG